MSELTVSTIRTNIIESPISGIDSIFIDSSGRTTAPNQPAFYGYRDAGTAWENYGGTPGVYNYNRAVTNRGNCYNTTNGTFTCPIPGVYALCPGALMGQGGADGTLYVYKNGVNVGGRGVHANTVGGNYWFHSSTVFMVRCNKADILQIRATSGAATIYPDKYAHCSIWLYS